MGWCHVYKDIYASQPEFSFVNVLMTETEREAMQSDETGDMNELIGDLLRNGTQEELVGAGHVQRRYPFLHCIMHVPDLKRTTNT